jgi:DNA-binding MarR family transcriptional regulator
MTDFGSKFSTPQESPGFLLWTLTNQWQRRQRAALAALELTHVQFVVLAAIAWLTRDQEEVVQVHVARFASLDRMMTSQVVRMLEQRGLLKRRVNTSDRRKLFLSLSEQGLSLVQLAMPVVEEVDRQFFSSAGDPASEVARLLRGLLEHDRA